LLQIVAGLDSGQQLVSHRDHEGDHGHLRNHETEEIAMTHDEIEKAALEVHQRWLDVHRSWWTEDHEVGKAKIRSIFPQGKNLHMFNADGTFYDDPEAIIAYWGQLAMGMEVTAVPTDSDRKVVVSDGLVCVYTRITMPFRMKGQEVELSMTIRGTEVYRNDDGEGRPGWRMWHCHYSREAETPQGVGLATTFSHVFSGSACQEVSGGFIKTHLCLSCARSKQGGTAPRDRGVTNPCP